MTAKRIIDTSDMGRKPSSRLKYEVGVIYTTSDKQPVILAKFQAYGDAYAYAIGLKRAPVIFEQIIIK